ncbi:MAG: hypothetical protein NVS2B7_33300 [Herpetosiphon sp.]
MDGLNDLVNRLASLTNGADEAASPVAPVCTHCGGSGFLRYDVAYGDPNFGKLRPCHCKQHEIAVNRSERLREMSQMGALATRSFSRFNTQRGSSAFSQQALEAALSVTQDYAANPHGWLILTGPSGCGKTHLAAAIANTLLDRSHGALWVFVPDFLDHLRTTFNPRTDVTYDELFAAVRDAPVLVLDDLGAHSASPWAEEKLYQILAHRYDAALPTVVTTSRLLETLDGKIRSRLQDATISRVVAVIGYTSEAVNRLMGFSYDLIRRMTFASYDPQPYAFEEGQRQSYNLNQALGLVQSYGRDSRQKKWLVLMGKHGVGKTHLAAAVANERLERGQPTLFIVTPDLLDALRASFSGEGGSSYDKVFYEVRATPFLILDDFGAESATAWAKEKLYQILNYRYNAQLPTLITTNQLLDTLDPALQSRLSDQEYCGLLPIIAPDYRRTRGTWPRRFR